MRRGDLAGTAAAIIGFVPLSASAAQQVDPRLIPTALVLWSALVLATILLVTAGGFWLLHRIGQKVTRTKKLRVPIHYADSSLDDDLPEVLSEDDDAEPPSEPAR